MGYLGRLLSALCLALVWLHSSAQAGEWDDAKAAFWQSDMDTVIRLLRPGAEQGNHDYQHFVGTAYYWKQDYRESATWYLLAANQGDAKAQQDLGQYYLQGKGVPRDYLEAYKWFAMAAANERDQPWQRWSNEELDRLEHQMSPEQVIEAQRRAKEWHPAGASALEKLLPRLSW
jgi:uncharacterized protein